MIFCQFTHDISYNLIKRPHCFILHYIFEKSPYFTSSNNPIFKCFLKLIAVHKSILNIFDDYLSRNSTSQPTHLSQSLKHIERPPNKLNHLKISNGPDLLSINTQSDQKTIGFVLKSGVTDEFKSGTSYLVSKMALNSSKTNENKLSEKLAAMNTVYDIQTTRDATFFAFSTGKENLSELFQIFSKVIF